MDCEKCNSYLGMKYTRWIETAPDTKTGYEGSISIEIRGDEVWKTCWKCGLVQQDKSLVAWTKDMLRQFSDGSPITHNGKNIGAMYPGGQWYQPLEVFLHTVGIFGGQWREEENDTKN